MTGATRAPDLQEGVGRQCVENKLQLISETQQKSENVAQLSGLDVSDSNTAALIVGLDSHGLSVARALADAGIHVHAICRKATPPGARTNRVRRKFPVRSHIDDSLIDTLVKVREELRAYEHVVLFATNDRHVTLIAENSAQICRLYRVSWEACTADVLKLQRKSELEAYSLAKGLRYPRSVVFSATGDVNKAVDFRYPVIIKPVRPQSSFKALLAHDAIQLHALVVEYAVDLPIIGQEYISGGDDKLYFGALLVDRGRPVFGMTGRKLASHPVGLGQTTIAETVSDSEVLRQTEQFFEGSTITGPVSLELKRDPMGDLWVIEPTVGRSDFWVELCIRAGFNQPVMEYCLALNKPPPLPTRFEECVWYDTERDPRSYFGLCVVGLTFRPMGKAPVFPYLGHRDWRPLIGAMMKLFSVRWARLFHRRAQ